MRSQRICRHAGGNPLGRLCGIVSTQGYDEYGEEDDEDLPPGRR
jgi:hypothetical protein